LVKSFFPGFSCEATSTHGGKYMKKTRRRYDREFKISVVAELERLLGQAHAEIDLLKKAFAMTQKKVREERIKPTLRDGI